VAIVGVNGAGKTTLLRLLSGRMSPSSGKVKLGHMVQPGYYAQIQAESLDLNKTIIQELEKTAPDMPVAQVRAIAGAFLFTGDAVEKKCAVLSGGEKARVALAKLLLSPSNFLILDEPTNHLDVESRGVLLDALSDYEGTLVLVSHDRAFVSPLVDTVLEIEPSPQGSRVTQLLGSYEDYLAKKTAALAEAKAALSTQGGSSSKSSGASSSNSSSTSATAKRTGPSNNQKNAWIREREQIEAQISKLEAEQARLSALMADPKTYEDKARSIALAEEQRKVDQTLQTSMARWEELCSLLEEAGL
jgi:ATP-binding cassette subfamily F protein 3